MPKPSPEEEVIAAYAAWNEAFNRGDVAAVARLYLDDAHFLPATHQVIVGPGGIAGFFTLFSPPARPTTERADRRRDQWPARLRRVALDGP